jgi:phospho-N-acetylmuramoyl-pentapeptide-transferase
MSYHLLTLLTLTAVSFLFGLGFTPILTELLYKFKAGKMVRDDGTTPIFSALHAGKNGTPNMAGILIWFTTAFLVSLFWFLDRVAHIGSFHILNILTRRETLLPLGAFIGASLVGLADDILDSRHLGYRGRGIRMRHKVVLYTLIAAIGAYWFYFKLGFSTMNVPFYGNVNLGWLYIPFFIFVVIATSFSVNETDGLDGLAGGALLTSFFAYTLIAYVGGHYDLAAFLSVVIGALLAFLWFNVHPAKFFMGDTGSMGLGTLLAVVAFYLNAVLVLVVIGGVFVVEALSYLAQIFYRKVLKRKFILSAPLHNHLQAIGWTESQVVMRLWIVSMVCAILGVVIHFAG